jgi:thiol-disulfide isomerase/thioredoxin
MTATDSPKANNRVLPAAIAALVGLSILVAVLTSGSSSEAFGFDEILLTTPEGDSTTLEAYSGKPMVVNFFAAWCPPCRAELPDIERIHGEFGDQVTIIGVSRDNTENAWKSLIAENSLTYPTLFEGIDGTLFESVGGVSMPTTLFVSADGEIVHSAIGLQDDESLRSLIDEHLLESAHG